jgi:hypothetical protein
VHHHEIFPLRIRTCIILDTIAAVHHNADMAAIFTCSPPRAYLPARVPRLSQERIPSAQLGTFTIAEVTLSTFVSVAES